MHKDEVRMLVDSLVPTIVSSSVSKQACSRREDANTHTSLKVVSCVSSKIG